LASNETAPQPLATARGRIYPIASLSDDRTCLLLGSCCRRLATCRASFACSGCFAPGWAKLSCACRFASTLTGWSIWYHHTWN